MNETIALLILAVLSAGALPAGATTAQGAGSYGVETVLTGTIQCERSGRSFESHRTFVLVDDRLSSERGEDGSDGFEVVSGQIDETGEVMLHGRYWWGREKTFWMKGTLQNGRLQASGFRGPKWCDLAVSDATES